MILLFRICTAAAQRLPRALLDFLVGTVSLRFGFFLHPLRRRIVLANYRRILAGQGTPPSEERLRSILERTRPLYSRLLVSMLCRPEDVSFAKERTDLEFWPLLEKAWSEGNGAILAVSNFGLFAHALMALFLRDVECCIPILDRRTVGHLPFGWAGHFRSLGLSSRDCLDALARNKTVVSLTMVNFLSRRPAYALFGAPARLSYAPAKLAAQSGAPILPVFSLYEGGRCRAVSDGLLRAEGPDPVRLATEALARVQEKYIAAYPEHWHVYEDFWDLRWMDLNYGLVKGSLRVFGEKATAGRKG